MATIGSTVLTLQDWAKRLDPDGKVPSIVEMLSQTNEVLTDMLFKEGNLPTGERVTMRTGLPTVAWRLLNAGVVPSKSTTAQIDEACGMLEAWSEVDKALAELNGNTNAFRLSEATAFIEAMNQEMASTLFYGNSGIDPEEFTGLSPRYSSLSASVPNSANIVSGSGSDSDLTSIWIVVWGAQSIYGIFPKGSKAGLSHEDHGEQTIETVGGSAAGPTRMRAYQDQWIWKCGIALKDWRFVVRIPNIDVSNLVGKTSAADLTELLIRGLHRIHNLRMGKAAIYMNRSVFQCLDIQRRDDVMAGGGLSYANVDGVLQPSFRNIPIRICDALLNSETAVS